MSSVKKSKAAQNWKLVGFVGVDSGQILICDPGYLPEHRTVPRSNPPVVIDHKAEWMAPMSEELYNPKFVGEFSYRGCCSTTLSFGAGQLYYRRGHLGAGVTSNTTYGDGIYPVYGRVDSKGKLHSLLIRLDDTDCKPHNIPKQRAGLIKRAKGIVAKWKRAQEKQMCLLQKGLKATRACHRGRTDSQVADRCYNAHIARPGAGSIKGS